MGLGVETDVLEGVVASLVLSRLVLNRFLFLSLDLDLDRELDLDRDLDLDREREEEDLFLRPLLRLGDPFLFSASSS